MPGIYIHIPFCVKKCSYCDFVSFADRSQMAAYLSALRTEIRLASALPGAQQTYDTVFIGGGTPSLLEGQQIAVILDALRRWYSIAPDAEISIECNPGTLSLQKLQAYRAAGVNRVSIGLQSASDGLLKRIGRIHTYAEFLQSVNWLKQSGFANWNADVMYGLPGQTVADYTDTLSRLIEHGAPHLSAYSLILEENTCLYHAVQSGRESLPDEDAVCDMQEAGFDLLEKAGYTRYEISNYAKSKQEQCRHNRNYWNNGAYLGLGLNAHGALFCPQWTRYCNTDDLNAYIARLKEEKLPHVQWDAIPPEEERFESVMLGLRMVEGIDLAAFSERFGCSFLDVYRDAVRELTQNGLLTVQDGFAALTDRGLDTQNDVLMYFL